MYKIYYLVTHRRVIHTPELFAMGAQTHGSRGHALARVKPVT